MSERPNIMLHIAHLFFHILKGISFILAQQQIIIMLMAYTMIEQNKVKEKKKCVLKLVIYSHRMHSVNAIIDARLLQIEF